MAGWILLFVEFIRSLSLSILLYTPQSVVMPVVIYELYETGALLPGPNAALVGPTFAEWLNA